MPAVLPAEGQQRSPSLVDILDRVLDKGLVVAGDIKVSLAEIELLTIRVRLLVCSIEKAEEIGIDWWRFDRHLTPAARVAAAQTASRRRVRAPERQIASLTLRASRTGIPTRPRRADHRLRRRTTQGANDVR